MDSRSHILAITEATDENLTAVKKAL